jgi:hypothetical protein
VKRAWENPAQTFWFISPTFEQAKAQYRRLASMLFTCYGVMLKKNQTELRIKLINQSAIVFKSGEVFQNLRGETLHGVVIDEMREQHPSLWSQVIRPMLTTTNGWAAFVSTPNGFDSFYDLAQKALTDTTGEWSFSRAPSSANPLISQDEIASLRGQMTEEEFKQEILAEFVNITQGSAYKNFGSWNQLEASPFAISPESNIWSPWLPIVLGPDFNLDPMAWAMGQHRNHQFYWFDEIFLRRSHTPEAAKEFVARYLELRKLGHKSEPNVIIAGDATAKAGQRAAAAQSDYDILTAALREAKITFSQRTPDTNPTVKDRVNTVNAHLKAADGSVSCWLHPSCKQLRKDFERVAWKSGANAILDQTTDTERTHISDGAGYAICALSPLKSGTGAGSLHVLHHGIQRVL